MNRFLASTSAVALCAMFAASAAYAGDSQPQAPANASTQATVQSELQRAQAERASGDLDGAAKAVQQLMLVAADNPQVVGEYGKILAEQGHAKDAIGFLSRATQHSTDWSLFSALGVAYDQNDDHAGARKAYERALALKPGEPSVLNNYAVSRMLTGDYAGAVQTLSQLQKADGANPKIAANLAKAEALLAEHPVKAMAPVAQAQAAKPQPQKPPAVAVASLPQAPFAKPGVVMQKIPSDPLAGPVRAANGAPRTLIAASRLTLAAEAAKLHEPAGAIVMQKVPADPKAGPVKTAGASRHAAKPRHAAETAKAAPAKGTPLSLRTASD